MSLFFVVFRFSFHIVGVISTWSFPKYVFIIYPYPQIYSLQKSFPHMSSFQISSHASTYTLPSKSSTYHLPTLDMFSIYLFPDILSPNLCAPDIFPQYLLLLQIFISRYSLSISPPSLLTFFLSIPTFSSPPPPLSSRAPPM